MNELIFLQKELTKDMFDARQLELDRFAKYGNKMYDIFDTTPVKFPTPNNTQSPWSGVLFMPIRFSAGVFNGEILHPVVL